MDAPATTDSSNATTPDTDRSWGSPHARRWGTPLFVSETGGRADEPWHSPWHVDINSTRPNKDALGIVRFRPRLKPGDIIPEALRGRPQDKGYYTATGATGCMGRVGVEVKVLREPALPGMLAPGDGEHDTVVLSRHVVDASSFTVDGDPWVPVCMGWPMWVPEYADTPHVLLVQASREDVLAQLGAANGQPHPHADPRPPTASGYQAKPQHQLQAVAFRNLEHTVDEGRLIDFTFGNVAPSVPASTVVAWYANGYLVWVVG